MSETPWADSPIHDKIREAGLDTAEGSLATPPCYQDLEDWIKEAAPILERAACIVIEENIDRLREIEGVRAILEMCPIDFTDNAKCAGTDASEKTL